MQSTSTDPSTLVRGKRTSWLLSLIAFAPLAILAALLVITDRNNATFMPLLDAFKTVSAVTLSFLGGIRWGMALRDASLRPLVLAGAMAPAAIGWICLFLPDQVAISTLLLTVCGMGAWDSFSIHGGAGPRWHAEIRTVMTLLTAFALSAVLLVIL